MTKKLAYGVCLSLLALFSHNIFACACGSDGRSDEEAFIYYQFIFVARITKAELIKPETDSFSINDKFIVSPVDELIRAKFVVIETFKGDPKQVTEIYGLPLGNSCGREIYVGGRYLIYTNNKRANLSACDRSHWVDNLKPPDEAVKDRNELNWLRSKVKNRK